MTRLYLYLFYKIPQTLNMPQLHDLFIEPTELFQHPRIGTIIVVYNPHQDERLQSLKDIKICNKLFFYN